MIDLINVAFVTGYSNFKWDYKNWWLQN